jgi:Peptidase M60, enhancin and enhancin-like
MAGGWGSYRVTVENGSGEPVTVKRFHADWQGRGDQEDRQGDELDIEIAAGAKWVKSEVRYMFPDLAEAAGEKTPVMAGVVAVQVAADVQEIPFSFEIPVAVLGEPTRMIKGTYVELALAESRFDAFENLERTARWMDQCYEAMADLTGGRPYDGNTVVLKESPEHPYWAYAGREIILNTRYVGSTLADFDKGLMSFGWVHEMGHDFDDGIGPWYIWSGPAGEWQANFKLCYAGETIEDQSFRYAWTFQPPHLPSPDRSLRLTGYELTEKMFLMYGDRYLADPNRSWETLESDEMHSLFQRIQRVYGWEIYKNWYRTYRVLKEKGFEPPESKEDKINLIVAILSREAKVDLVPVFQQWRLPVSQEQVAAMTQKYELSTESSS